MIAYELVVLIRRFVFERLVRTVVVVAVDPST
jgi:hypothetical protein